MYKMISWWARNPKAANLLMAGIIIVGIATFSRIEQEVFPKISAPVVSVHYIWPGASPKEVEDQILVRVEESLKEIKGIEKVDLDLVWDPPWDKSMMSEAAKLELNLWINKL